MEEAILKSQPLVSLIVPVYNVGDFVERCLRSVMNQTYPNLEIIIVNDGSTDDSATICRKVTEGDDRVIVLNQENCGLGLARDSGINAASGEWICFVDSDDWVALNFVEELLSAAIDNDCLIAQCKYMFTKSERQPAESSQANVKLFDWRSFWLYAWTAPQFAPTASWDKIYHRSVLSDLRFGDFRFSEDNLFVVKAIYAARAKKLALVESTLYYYYYRENSLTHNHLYDIAKITENYRAKTAMLNFLYEINEPSWISAGHKFCLQSFIDTYLQFSCKSPNEREKVLFLRNKILSDKRLIQNKFPQLISVLTGSDRIFERLKCSGLILYGFGRAGQQLHLAFKHLDVSIAAIWDKHTDGTVYDGTPIRYISNEFSSDTIVGIAVADEFQHSLVECELSDAGYNNTLSYGQLIDTVKWANLVAYLPELLIFNN